MKKIGILGGTFDPIHNGHLLIAEAAWQQLGLDEVWFMVSGNPPHKRNRDGLATDVQRIRMTQLAIEGNSHFKLSLEDMDPETGFSFTHVLMKRLSEKYPDYEFYFIIGGDSLRDFHTWRNPEIITKYTYIVAAVRDEINQDLFEKALEENRKRYGDVFLTLKTPVIQISSSEIRQMVHDGESVRYRVPDAVLKVILKEKIYHAPGTDVLYEFPELMEKE